MCEYSDVEKPLELEFSTIKLSSISFDNFRTSRGRTESVKWIENLTLYVPHSIYIFKDDEVFCQRSDLSRLIFI